MSHWTELLIGLGILLAGTAFALLLDWLDTRRRWRKEDRKLPGA